MIQIILFSFYPIFNLILGNYARIFFFPLTLFIGLQKYLKGELNVKKEFIYLFIILFVFNISLSLIQTLSLKFLILHIGQVSILILFSSVSKKFVTEINQRLIIIAHIIITFVFLIFLIKTVGFDITTIMNASRYLEIKYELSRVIPIKDVVYSLTEGIDRRLSLGNPTLMCTFLILIMLMQESKSKTLQLAKLFTPVFFLAGSRTFLGSIIIYFSTQINLLRFLKRRKIIIFLLITLIISNFFLLNKNFYTSFTDQISSFMRTDILKPQEILLDESRRISFYMHFFKNIDNFLFWGGGPGYSFQFIQDFFGYRVSSESTYLRLILDYGLFPSILLIIYFFIKIKQTNYLNNSKILVFLISALTITYLDNDLFYVLLGISCNSNLSNNK